MAKKNKIKAQKTHASILGDFLFCSLLAVVLVLSYHSSLSRPFYFDSPLTLNAAGLKEAFPHFSFLQLLQSTRYIAWYTFGMNYDLSGMDEFGFTLSNLIIHIANTVLLYFFLKLLFDRVLRGMFPQKSWYQFCAFVGAFLFSANPAALYAVVYVVQRFVLLSLFFSLLSLISFLKGFDALVAGDAAPEKSRPGIFSAGFFLSALFYFMAVHSKEHAVMLPLVLFCLAILLGGIRRHHLRPLFLPALLYLLIAAHTVYLLQWAVGAVYEPNAPLVLESFKTHVPAAAAVIHDQGRMFLQSSFNQAWLFFRYLYLWLIPDVSRMALDLPLPFVTGFWVWPETLGVPLYLGVVVFSLRCLLRRGLWGLLGFGLICPALLFATELSTVRFHENFVLYRSYLWMVGLFSVVPVFLRYILKNTALKWAVSLGLVVYATVFLWAVQHRLRPFVDALQLWKDVVEKIDLTDKSIPSSYRSAANYGTEVGNSGDIKEAIRYFRISAELNPGYVKAWDGLGAALAMDGKLEEGIQHLQKAIAINPSYKESYYNLGTIYASLNRPLEAIESYQRAIALSPDYDEALYNLGNTYMKVQRFEEAIQTYTQLLNVDPQNIDGRHNKGIALAQLGRHEEALREYDAVIQKNPVYAKVHYNKANSLAVLGKNAEALENYLITVKGEPGHVYALHNAGLMSLRLGDLQKARELFQQALAVEPSFSPSRTVLEEIGKTP